MSDEPVNHSAQFDYVAFMRENPHRVVNPEMEDWLINHLLENKAYDVVAERFYGKGERNHV